MAQLAEVRERPGAGARLSADSDIANALLPTPTDATRRLAAAEADQAALLATNERLQRHIRGVLDLRHKGGGGGENQLGTAEARYSALRARLVEHRAMLEATSRHYDRTIDEMRETLQTRLNRTTSIQNVRGRPRPGRGALCLDSALDAVGACTSSIAAHSAARSRNGGVSRRRRCGTSLARWARPRSARARASC